MFFTTHLQYTPSKRYSIALNIYDFVEVINFLFENIKEHGRKMQFKVHLHYSSKCSTFIALIHPFGYGISGHEKHICVLII
jgi:hypothetical protein